MKVLATKRLLLEVTTESDIPILHRKIFSYIEVMRFVFGGKPLSLCDTAMLIKHRFNMNGAKTGLSTLKEKSTGEIVGFAGILPCRPFDEDGLEIGFVLDKSVWGKGYATEIGKAQINFGFQQMSAKRLFAMAHPKNIQSIKVISKLGMKHKADITDNERGPRKLYYLINPGPNQ